MAESCVTTSAISKSTNNLVATAKHTFSDHLDATVTLGQNLNSRRYRDNLGIGTTLIAPIPFDLQNTLKQTGTEFHSLRHIQAYFAQGEVDLYNQFVINLGVRDDGFSTFGASSRRATYPKASAAWTFSNLINGGDRTGIFSYGKLHLAYGETGREPPVYSTVNGYEFNPIATGGFGDALNPTIELR